MPRKRHAAQYLILGLRLQRARRSAALTQVEAANALGYLQSYISKCEKGERRVDLFELQEFAELYGVSMDAMGAPVTPEEQFEAAARRAHPDDEDYG